VNGGKAVERNPYLVQQRWPHAPSVANRDRIDVRRAVQGKIRWHVPRAASVIGLVQVITSVHNMALYVPVHSKKILTVVARSRRRRDELPSRRVGQRHLRGIEQVSSYGIEPGNRNLVPCKGLIRVTRVAHRCCRRRKISTSLGLGQRE